MEIYIEKVKNYSIELTEAINKLLRQLDESASFLTKEDVKSMIASPVNSLFVARRKNNKEIVGMLTLIVYRIPVGKKGWLEDLVIDKVYRNKGIATKLIHYAIGNAKANGVLYVNFTSRPEKKDANRLYRRLGFEKRNTNVYRIEL